MKSNRLHRFVSLICVALVCAAPPGLPVARAADHDMIVVQADKPGAAINPHMFGVFFEDINFAADGGIYAEMVKNRSFEFPEPLMGWKKIEARGGHAALEVLDKDPLNAGNLHYLRVRAAGESGVSNEGFRGIGVRQGAAYNFSVYARRADGKLA